MSTKKKLSSNDNARRRLSATYGKNDLPPLKAIPCPAVVIIFCVDARVDGLVDVLGFSFPVTDADARKN